MPESNGVIKLEQNDKSLKDQEKVAIHLQIYPQLIFIYTHNAEDKINQIIDKALYSFHHSGIETIVEINTSSNMESTIMFPTSQSKKEMMVKELNSMLNKIKHQSQLEENLEKINILAAGIKLYEQFEINSLKST